MSTFNIRQSYICNTIAFLLIEGLRTNLQASVVDGANPRVLTKTTTKSFLFCSEIKELNSFIMVGKTKTIFVLFSFGLKQEIWC